MDPEGGPVSYSIVSGNDLREFGINSKTGVISVVRKLDREQLTQYQLVCPVPTTKYSSVVLCFLSG